MTKNEEKAREIIQASNANQVYDIVDFNALHKVQMEDLLEMAEWKDEELDSAIDKAIERNGKFLKQEKITQYGFDIAFTTIQNIRAYLKKEDEK